MGNYLQSIGGIMAIYYLIRGNTIEQEIDSDTAVTALPLLGGGNAVSLLNQVHVIAIMNRTGLNAAQIIDYLGLVDEREV